MTNFRGYDPFADVPQVDVQTAHRQLLEGEAELVDVREGAEWDLGHIDGIKFIPLGDLPVRWKNWTRQKSGYASAGAETGATMPQPCCARPVSKQPICRVACSIGRWKIYR